MTAGFDTQRAERFENTMVDVLNHGALALMTSVGHRTGLFATMTGAGDLTSTELARRAGLHERYVREWLGAMTVGGVVEHDPRAGTYRLPDEHAGVLTDEAEGDTLAVFAQYIPMLGGVEDDLVRCFREGGGVPYERYGRFHEIMAEDSGQTVLPALDEYILPLVPGLKERLTAGVQVLDVGCGRGHAANLLAARYPASRFHGVDLAAEAIAAARQEAADQGLENVSFEQRDLSDFDRTAPANTYHLITTFDAVHDQKNPKAVLAGIRRALTEDGVYLAQDIRGSSHHHQDREHPIGPLLYTLSCMHCMTVSLAQDGEGLGAMWGEEKAVAYFREAGFSQVEVHQLEHDIQNNYYVCRP